jgi:hypothetical protein
LEFRKQNVNYQAASQKLQPTLRNARVPNWLQFFIYLTSTLTQQKQTAGNSCFVSGKQNTCLVIMAEKPEYWILTSEKVNELIENLYSIGETILENISTLRIDKAHAYSIWKLKTIRGWIGFTIEKPENDHRIVFVSSLIKEEPLEFNASLKYWNEVEQSEVILFDKSYQDLHEISSDIMELSISIKRELREIPLFA